MALAITRGPSRIRSALSRQALALLLASIGVWQLTACSREDAAGAPPPGLDPPPPAFRPVSALPAAPDVDAPIVQLGKSLFRDERLSANGQIACASCHDVASGGDDGRRVSVGFAGRETAVNAPTVLNSGLNFSQFWDGRARTLREQVRETLTSEIEMGANPHKLVQRLSRDDSTVDRFEYVFRDGLTFDNVVSAIAAYVDALITPGAPFDRFLSGEADAISSDAREGFELFTSLGCISCHQGRNLGGNLYQNFGIMGDYFADRGHLTRADYGRFNVTGREEDRYRFKVPTLRNVTRTAPYFHDGSATTIEDAVEVMAQYQLGRPVRDSEVALLVAFLDSLSADVAEPLR